MTPAQQRLLQRLIEADRAYRTAVNQADPWVSNDWRGVEISPLFGVSPRTAESLMEMGLCEIVNMGNRNCVFLGRYNPYDENAYAESSRRGT